MLVPFGCRVRGSMARKIGQKGFICVLPSARLVKGIEAFSSLFYLGHTNPLLVADPLVLQRSKERLMPTVT